jgi:hypothetical protein
MLYVDTWWATFSREPVLRLCVPTTRLPSERSRSQRWLPSLQVCGVLEFRQ